MSTRRKAALLAGLVLVAMFANAASRNNAMRIKVLGSETRSVGLGGNDVPKNCDSVNFDAYCNNSKAAVFTNTLLVQEGNGPAFRVACTIDSKYSRCTPLAKGGSFDARREKHGITIYYQDDNGKARSQFYTLVVPDAKGGSPANAATVADPPAPAPAENAGQAPAAAVAPVAAASPPPNVKCSFSSTPPGADVTLDGRYVGSTPSVLGVGTGTHVVQMSLPGFAQWKRELTVASGSELTVNAVLQKTQ